MKCIKCKNEMEDDDKFCPQCGEKRIVEENLDPIEVFTQASQVWFSLGVKYGILYEKKKFDKIKELDKELTKDPDFAVFYNKSLEFAKKNVLTKLNESEQKDTLGDRKAH